MTTPRVEVALGQIKAFFHAEPDARLSVDDAVTVTGLDRPLCKAMLEALADVRFLTRQDEVTFVRRR